MKIGFVSSALPEFNAKRLSEIATNEILGGIEIQCWPVKRSKFNTYGYSQYEESDNILALGYYPNWLSASVGERPGIELHFKSLIDIAHRLRIPISTHAGANNNISLEDNLDLLSELFRPILQYAESMQVAICMETSTFQNARPFGTNIGSLQRVWDTWLNWSPMTMLTWDTAQAHLSGNSDLILSYLGRIGHIHARDIRNTTTCSPGIGEIDWDRFFHKISRYQGAVCLEYDTKYWDRMSLNDRIGEMHHCSCLFTGTTPRCTNDYGISKCQNTLDTAVDYIHKGWEVIPILFRNKESGLDYWPSVKITKSNASDYFQGLQNIAISFGNNLVDVDIDHPKAVELAPQFLPPTGAVFGRKSKPRSHYLYYSSNATPLNARSWAVEIRCGSLAYTVMPPSTHINGEEISWCPGVSQTPAFVDGFELSQAVRKLADAAVESGEYSWPS